MDVGFEYALATPGGTIVFNDGADPGYMLTLISGVPSAQIRNPTTDMPHADGAIVHRFRRGATFVVVEGVLVGDDPDDREALGNALDAALQSIIFGGPGAYGSTDGTWSWTPPGASGRAFTVRLFEALEIEGPSSGAGSSPSGIAGPKTFSFTLVSDRPHAWSY